VQHGFRTASIASVRFDERLPLYGWHDKSGMGSPLGTKRGKGSEVRLGYSQIVNPAYIVSKGNMSLVVAFQLASRNFLANIVKSTQPESYVDRRGRLRGNMIGLFHLMTGRLTPEYILTLT
jgi:hypothetical protein